MGKFSGSAMSVLGAIDPDKIGVTMMHEHLYLDVGVAFVPPQHPDEAHMSDAKVCLSNLGWIRINWTSNRDNLLLLDEDLMIREAHLYREAGGRTIVDTTSIGISRNPEALVRISRATGLNVIMGTGYYVGQAHPPEFSSISMEAVTEQIVRDVTEGVGGTGVRSGIIGEIGCSWPWTNNEKKSVAAAVAAQQETGATVLIHPGRDQRAPLEVLSFVEREGGDLSRTVMAHIDMRISDYGVLRETAATGVYMEFDGFGIDPGYPPHAPTTRFPSDHERIDMINVLLDEGRGDRILIAHDVCTKHRLREFGGHGMDHILRRVVPWMRITGISDEQLDAMLVQNPRRVLTII